jgi:hypothetical protein
MLVPTQQPTRVTCTQESEAAAAAAHSLAQGVTFSHPSLPAWLRSKQVAANILTEQHGFLQHLADAGERRLVHMQGDVLHATPMQFLDACAGNFQKTSKHTVCCHNCHGF